MRYVRANGLEIWLETAGTGPPLLFLGGTGWDLRRTREPLGPRLTRHFTVALFDQRGQGQSAKPPGPYSMEDYAEDALGVLDALGWNKAHVVGYSFGGMVAQELAIRHPARIDRLVLAATTSGGAGGSSYPIEDFIDLPPVERARRGLEIADLRFAILMVSDPKKARARIDARTKNQTRFMHEPRAREGLKEQLRARAAHDAFDRLETIEAETLVVAGTFDGQAPQRSVETLAKKIPSGVLRTVSGAHDFIGEDNEFFELLVSFLASNPQTILCGNSSCYF
jgi:3-oxoadipate enol-lactonase